MEPHAPPVSNALSSSIKHSTHPESPSGTSSSHAPAALLTSCSAPSDVCGCVLAPTRAPTPVPRRISRRMLAHTLFLHQVPASLPILQLVPAGHARRLSLGEVLQACAPMPRTRRRSLGSGRRRGSVNFRRRPRKGGGRLLGSQQQLWRQATACRIDPKVRRGGSYDNSAGHRSGRVSARITPRVRIEAADPGDTWSGECMPTQASSGARWGDMHRLCTGAAGGRRGSATRCRRSPGALLLEDDQISRVVPVR